MDARFGAEHAGFRAEVRGWLEGALPAGWIEGTTRPPADVDALAELYLDWDRQLFAGGWAGLAWPREYGGRGASLVEQVIFNEELARVDAPKGIAFLGKDLLGPTLMAHGDEAQKRRYLPRILSAEDVWCQGFSEPDAGSDLAAIRTTARREGDRFVVGGQKVWTSWAKWATWCFALVRTSTGDRKHDGLTFLLIDMRSPGVTVRPLVQITGSMEFVELFLEDVEVPAENVVGEVGGGWKIAMTTLSFERGPMVTARAVRLQRELEHLMHLARRVQRRGRPVVEDPLIRVKLARLHAEVQILRYNSWRSLTRMLRGEPSGPEASIGKVFWSETHQRLTSLALEILGPQAVLWRGAGRWLVDDGWWQERHLSARGETIYAGTSEIQRNIIGERVLGLPR